jgi:transposase-like protein
MTGYQPLKSFNRTEEGIKSLHAIFNELLETEDREIMDWAGMGKLLQSDIWSNFDVETHLSWLKAEMAYYSRKRNATFCNANSTAWIEGLILAHQ